MNIKKQMKLLACTLAVILIPGMFSACGDDEDEKEQNWQVYLPSTIVANGDYLTTSVYGSSGYDFKVNYYWDGTLIQTTDKKSGINFLIANWTKGDHTLKMEYTGDARGTSEYIIY